MTSHDTEWNEARRVLRKCRACGWVPTMEYEPGVTWAKCPCGKSECLPDWQPGKLAQLWNVMRGVKQ